MNKKHTFFWKLLRPIVIAFLKIKFGYTFEYANDLPENYIVLSNHVTDFDPLFVACSFKRQMYFVASEHISRWKHAFGIVNFLLAPILRYKGTVAASTVREILHKTREGGNVAIFAEGLRSWDGLPNPILPSTGKLVKTARCGLVTYKITGGYFVSPGWSEEGTRRGPIHGAPVNIYTKEELAKMSVKEINEIIVRDLYDDAYARQLADPKPYKGRKLARRLENLLFVCPVCGEIDTFSSEKDTVSCSTCGFSLRYNQYGFLENAPFKTVQELAAWQKNEVAKHAENSVEYRSGHGVLQTVADHHETIVAEGEISVNEHELRCGDFSVPLCDISDMGMHGRHAIVFSTVDKGYYELLPDDRYNTYKFQLLYEAYMKQRK